MVETQTIQGRPISEQHVAEIRRLIEAHPQWNRRRISEVLAQQWDWRNAVGQLKDMALLKLHQRQLIRLPERRRQPPRRAPLFNPELFDALVPETIEAELASLQPLQICLLGPKEPGYQILRRYLVRHHYLSYGGPVGENLNYLIRSCAGVDLACLVFGAAAWKCAPRDQWIGWSAEQRAAPWVRVRCLASHLLSQITCRIDRDWQKRYGHRLYLLESFVQADRFRGISYQAANWIHVGQTTGRTRQDRLHRLQAPLKDIYLYPLSGDGRQQLAR